MERSVSGRAGVGLIWLGAICLIVPRGWAGCGSSLV